jgi:hypothetical protein
MAVALPPACAGVEQVLEQPDKTLPDFVVCEENELHTEDEAGAADLRMPPAS